MDSRMLADAAHIKVRSALAHGFSIYRKGSPMAQYFVIHPSHPQPRLLQQAAQIVHGGGLIVYPTDSCYALGCQIGNKPAMDRIRAIRDVDDRHHFTLVCRDLSEIAH